MMADPLEFYFEFASPYGYFASLRIDDIAARHGREVLWRPIMLGAALKVTGMAPLAQQPVRRDYFFHDVPRMARLLGVPLRMPEVQPMNSLAAGRAFYWLEATDAALARELARAVYRAHWQEGRDMSPAEAVSEVAAPLGIDGEALLAAIQDPAVKQRYKEVTEAAIARGVFGSPFVIVDGEPFWGSDRLDQVDRWLGGGW